MKLFDVLALQAHKLETSSTKIHIACSDGKDDPLDVYIAKEFKKWQERQTKRNFKRKYIVSLIQFRGSDRFLFAGVYKSLGCEYLGKNRDNGKDHYSYKTEIIPSFEDLSGRLIVSFKRSKQSYLLAENCIEDMLVVELRPHKITIKDFPGYNKTSISKSTLDIIVKQNLKSWHSALSNVSGVYLITDKTNGKLYVGSATGEDGIWQRWCDYSSKGHGGNKELKKILEENGDNYADNFQYSILEIADTHTSKDDVTKREEYWKNILCCKEHGYNEN